MYNPICYITIGIPNSGKSTWSKKQGIPILSCDDLRNKRNSGKKYIFDPKIEKEVWEEFYEKVKLMNRSFIIDNTNCKIGSINKIKENLHKNYQIEYVWFDIPLWKALYRNFKRRIFENKWIPIEVMKTFYKNYNKLKDGRKMYNL